MRTLLIFLILLTTIAHAILADGRRTLLYDNHYIDQSKVNRVVEIPEVFEGASPFGAEFLVVAARTEAFPPIQTYLIMVALSDRVD